jgi:hypothetical protein
MKAVTIWVGPVRRGNDESLTIWQPWASLIMIGAKPYEFRGRSYLRYPNRREPGERVAIHAGAAAASARSERYAQSGVTHVTGSTSLSPQ